MGGARSSDRSRTETRPSSSSSRRRSSSSSRRKSALDRLGPKVPVVSRLGAGKVSRKRRRPGSRERREASGDKDNMQITIDGGDKDQGSTSRKVARDVDIENFKVLDEVGEGEEEEKKDENTNEDEPGDDKS